MKQGNSCSEGFVRGTGRIAKNSLRAGLFAVVMVMACLLCAQPQKAQADTYNNSYGCINKLLAQMGEGNYSCIEDKEKKKLSIQLLKDVEISDGCSFDGDDDFKKYEDANWIPLSEMEITLDFNGHYMDFTGSDGFDLLYGVNVIFTNSGGIKTSQNITSLITVWGSTLKIKKSDSPAAGEAGKTAGVPSFLSTYSESNAVNNVIQISRYSDEDGNYIYSDVDIENVYISTEKGIGIAFVGGTLDIEYATITAKRAAIENMSRTSDNRICIYDGIYTATDEDPAYYSAAISVIGGIYGEQVEPVYGYTYIYGGTYTGYDAVYISDGKAYVSGNCSFAGSGYAAFVVSDGTLVFADDQSTVIGGTSGAVYAADSDVLISGGSFSTADSSVIYGNHSDVKIKAGSFDSTNSSSMIELKGGSLSYLSGILNGAEVTEDDLTTTDKVVVDENTKLCSSGNGEGTYRITYVNAEGLCGAEFNPVTVNAGETYPLQDLYMPGAFFGGWYTDEACTREITELSNVTSDMKLYFKLLDRDRNEKKLTTISYATNIVKDCTELEPFDLGVTILSGDTTAEISYTFSNNNIATLTEDGKIQLTGEVGDVCILGHIPGTEDYFSKDFDIVLSVNKRVATITYTRPEEAISIQGGAVSLKAKVEDTNGVAAGDLIFTSSDPETISVDRDGNLKAHKEGSVEITITMEETDRCIAGRASFYVSSKWSRHEVFYHGNGGKISKVEDSLVEEQAYGELPIAKREGYSFDGWYTEENGGSKVTSDTLVPSTEGQNQNLYAHWTAIEYSIAYQLNGGANNKENPTTYTVETNTITLKAPTKTGYTFEGWYRDNLFQSQIVKIETGSMGNVTVYAKWKKNSDNNSNNNSNGDSKDTTHKSYKITYQLNKGKNHKSNPTSYTSTTQKITLKSPTRKGYQFAGWYMDKQYKNRVKTIAKGSRGDITLYAKWKKVSYKITYKLKKGKNSKKNPKKYTITTKTFSLKSATRKGYKFAGWYTDKKLKHRVRKIKKGSTGKVVLYAKWKKR